MERLERDDRRAGEVLRQNGAVLSTGEELAYLTFPSLEETGIAEHLITTRTGGVSRGEFSAMNVGLSRGDREEDVRENFRRVGEVMGCALEDMVLARQTHTTNIRHVTAQDRGKGIVRPFDYQDVDGLITDEPGLVLVTTFADCVPLLFVDPVRRAVGSAHSGWRGTAGRMGEHMVRAMGDAFGSRPEDLLAAIGPSICQECYEVSDDVAREFADADRGTESLRRELSDSGRFRTGENGEPPKVLTPGKRPGKYQLDLWLANYLILRQAGIPGEKIAVTDICTCHNSACLFSHRASGGRRGAMGVFLGLRRMRQKDDLS